MKKQIKKSYLQHKTINCNGFIRFAFIIFFIDLSYYVTLYWQ
jgi:hypothetical protein